MKRRATGSIVVMLAVILTACSSSPPGRGAAPATPAPSATTGPSSPQLSPAATSPASGDGSGVTNAASPGTGKPEASGPPTPTDDSPAQTSATLIAVGDIMVHSPQISSYYVPATDGFEVSSWFREVKPILSQGDWVIANLETPVAGKDLKYTGYPRFNAPKGLLNAVRGAGFELVSTANNHAMDRGFPGIQRTLKNVRAAGLIPVGTSVSATDSKRQVIVEKNGIKMGFLAYTYGTNGIPVPKDHSYAVNLIDMPKIRADIAKLRKAGVDAVTVSMHFGIEYQRMPNELQISQVRELVAAGADIVLGSHPHVVQPYDTIDVDAADSFDKKPRKGIAIYSMGNFISNQYDNWKDVGLIFGVRLTKTRQQDGTYRTSWDQVTAVPTWVHIRMLANGKRSYTIIPLQQALASRDDPELTAADYVKMKTLYDGIEKHIHKLEPVAS